MVDGRLKAQTPELIHQHITPKPFLGDEDGAVEWGQDPKPIRVFLPTESYKVFKRYDSLYLFGRRGTGKTTILNMLEYEIEQGLIRDYSYVSVIEQEEAFHGLSMNIRTSPLSELPQNELVFVLIEKWEWAITISAMVSVVRGYRSGKRKSSKKQFDDLRVIERYLTGQDFLAGGNGDPHLTEHPLRRVSKILTEELKAIDYIPTRIGAALLQITDRLFTSDFSEANRALRNILGKSKSPCLVLIDSIELYNLRDDISQAVLTALIEAVRKFYVNLAERNILAKAAFPSEIYPHLSSLNQEKTERKTLFILWRYRDIVSVLAKRYLQMLDETTTALEYDRLNDFVNAKEFIYRYLSRKVVSRNGVEFDTLAYVIRHTQKKPREIIMLLNIVLTLAEERRFEMTAIPPEVIVDGIHARPDILVKGVLDMYSQIFPKANEIVRRALTEAPSFFDYSTLDILLKEVASLRKKADLGGEQIKRLLLECGVLGIVQQRHNLSQPRKELIECLFEYQVKGTLEISNRTRCAIHPMFFQVLRIDVDPDAFTYPMPAEDEEIETLAEAGVHLA